MKDLPAPGNSNARHIPVGLHAYSFTASAKDGRNLYDTLQRSIFFCRFASRITQKIQADFVENFGDY